MGDTGCRASAPVAGWPTGLGSPAPERARSRVLAALAGLLALAWRRPVRRRARSSPSRPGARTASRRSRSCRCSTTPCRTPSTSSRGSPLEPLSASRVVAGCSASRSSWCGAPRRAGGGALAAFGLTTAARLLRRTCSSSVFSESFGAPYGPMPGPGSWLGILSGVGAARSPRLTLALVVGSRRPGAGMRPTRAILGSMSVDAYRPDHRRARRARLERQELRRGRGGSTAWPAVRGHRPDLPRDDRDSAARGGRAGRRERAGRARRAGHARGRRDGTPDPGPARRRRRHGRRPHGARRRRRVGRVECPQVRAALLERQRAPRGSRRDRRRGPATSARSSCRTRT